MKRLLFLFLLPLLLTSPKLSFAQENWVIESFDSAIFIPKDGKVQVVETIAVDFGTLAKYGIFRTIPAGGIRFRLRSVKQDGQSAKVGTSSSGGEAEAVVGEE